MLVCEKWRHDRQGKDREKNEELVEREGKNRVRGKDKRKETGDREKQKKKK